MLLKFTLRIRKLYNESLESEPSENSSWKFHTRKFAPTSGLQKSRLLIKKELVYCLQYIISTKVKTNPMFNYLYFLYIYLAWFFQEKGCLFPFSLTLNLAALTKLQCIIDQVFNEISINLIKILNKISH